VVAGLRHGLEARIVRLSIRAVEEVNHSGYTERISPCRRRFTAADANSPKYPGPDRCGLPEQHVLPGGQTDPVGVWHHGSDAAEHESLELDC